MFAPAVLAAPGKYFVTDNLSVAAGSVITITSGNVELDLNGFTLSSTATAPVITATGVDGITIRNGTIIGGGSNVSILNSARVVIEDIRAVGPIGGGPPPTGRCIILNNTMEYSIRGVTVRNAPLEGILVTTSAPGVPFPPSGSIENNQIQGCMGGITVAATSASVRISNNRIQIADGWGISVQAATGVLISENTVDGPGTNTSEGGIFLANVGRSKIYNNVVSQAGGAGIYLSLLADDNLVLNNVVGQSASIGLIVVGDRNHIEGNVLNGNASSGLYFALGADNNVYRRNTARGNAGAGCSVAACVPDFCDEGAGNTSPGDNFLPGPAAACL